MRCQGLVAVSRGEVRLRELDVREPGRHEILIRTAASLVSAGTERAWVLGQPNTSPKFPFSPGYCLAGRVERLGPETTGFSAGDRVACYADGMGHREFATVPERLAVPIPPGVSFAHAAFASLGQTSLQGVRKCRVELGETAAVFGLGVVGLLALRFAVLNGALVAIALDRDVRRLDLARECGADFVVDCGESGWERKLRDASGGNGPQIALDCTGMPDGMVMACSSAADFARVCVLGSPRGAVEFNFYRDAQKKSLSIIGAHAVDSVPRAESYPRHWTFAADAACFLGVVAKGCFPLDRLIDKIAPKGEAEAAYGEWLRGQAGSSPGLIIDWS